MGVILAKCDSALHASCQEDGFWSLRDGHSLASDPLFQNIHSSKHLLGVETPWRSKAKCGQSLSFCGRRGGGQLVTVPFQSKLHCLKCEFMAFNIVACRPVVG
jgi:hypothetical protein